MAHKERNYRRTRRRDVESIRRTMIKGLIVIALFGLFMYVGLSSYNGVPLTHYTDVTVDVPEIGNLIQHDPVRIAGVRVGQVVGEGVTSTGQAQVKLQIDPGTRLPQGTQVMIRANGLLGARYVQLIPSDSRTLLANHATISGNPNSYTYGVPEVLAVFNSQTRTSLGQLINGLGTGLLGQGSGLSSDIGQFGTGLANFTRIADAILARQGSAGRLVPSLNATMVPLNANRQRIADLLGPGATAFRPFVTDRSQVRSVIAQAPGTLDSAQSGLSAGEELLDSADALAQAGQRTLPLLPNGLKNTTTLLADAPGPLTQARSLLDAATPAIPATLRITSALNPDLAPATQVLTKLEPILNYIGPRGCALENFGVTMRSMTGFGGDGNGPVGYPMQFRAQALPGPEALAPIGALDPDEHDAYSNPCQFDDSAESNNPPIGGEGR